MKNLANLRGAKTLDKTQLISIFGGDACPTGLCLTLRNGRPRCVRCGEEPPPDQ